MNRKLIKHAMRTVLVAVLIQFFSPVLIAEQARAEAMAKATRDGKPVEPSTGETISFVDHPHNSFSLLLFLKELKESEEDEEGRDQEFLLPLILDLAHHSYILTRTHESKAIRIEKFDDQYDYQPPLFKLHCIFVI